MVRGAYGLPRASERLTRVERGCGLGVWGGRSRARRFLQRHHLTLIEIPELTGTDVLVVDRADANPPEADDGVADRVAHAADLPIAAFVKRDREQRILAVARLEDLVDPDLGRRRLPPVHHHTC